MYLVYGQFTAAIYFCHNYSSASKAGTAYIEMSTLSEVPLIDFAKCGLEVENDLDDEQVLDGALREQLYGALRDCGFTYLRHAGISLEDVAKA